MTAIQRNAAAVERAKKNAARKAEKEAAMGTPATTTTTTGAKRPKVTIVVEATTTISIKSYFPFERLGKVFKEVVLEKQLVTPADAEAYSVVKAKFVYRAAGLSDILGTPSLNLYEGNNGLYISKNKEYDIDGKKGKYSALNGWAGKADLSKEAVSYVKALITAKMVSF